MGIKKKEWFEMKRNGLMFEITVRDQDWKRLEQTKFSPHDFTKTMKDIGNRYGIDENMLAPGNEVQEEVAQMKRSNLF